MVAICVGRERPLRGHSGTLAQPTDLRPETEQPGGRIAEIFKELSRFIHLIGLCVAALVNPKRRREEPDQRQEKQEPQCPPPLGGYQTATAITASTTSITFHHMR